MTGHFFRLFLVLVGMAACNFNSQEDRAAERGLPLPTKDEVVLVDGRPLSIAGFMAVRTALSQATTQSALWIGMAALAIQNETRARGREMAMTSAVEIARYALNELSLEQVEPALRAFVGKLGALPPPTALRHDVELLLARAVIQRNIPVIAELQKTAH